MGEDAALGRGGGRPVLGVMVGSMGAVGVWGCKDRRIRGIGPVGQIVRRGMRASARAKMV